MPIAVQIITHDGVALILEMPQNGRSANPPMSITIAMPVHISQNSVFFPRLTNLRYNTDTTTPAMVRAGIEPSPTIPYHTFLRVSEIPATLHCKRY